MVLQEASLRLFQRLDRVIKISDNFLRHIIIRQDEN